MRNILPIFTTLVIGFVIYCLVVKHLHHKRWWDARRYHWAVVDFRMWKTAVGGTWDCTMHEFDDSVITAGYKRADRFEEKWVPKFIR